LIFILFHFIAAVRTCARKVCNNRGVYDNVWRNMWPNVFTSMPRHLKV